MTEPSPQGCCVLVDVSAAEVAQLAALPGLEVVPSPELAGRLTAVDQPVDLVVIGSLASSALSLVQRAHSLSPDACVAVIAPDPNLVRRQASYTPGVPLDLVVAGADDADLVHRLELLRRTGAARRQHGAVLAAVMRSTMGVPRLEPSALTAVGALLEHARLAALVVTPSGQLLGWNRRAEDLFHLEPAMSGGPVDEVIPEAVSLLTPAPGSAGPGAHPDTPRPSVQVRIGDRVDVEVSAVESQTDQGRPVVLLLAVDVTAHRQAERERDRLAAHVALLGRISESLMESLDVAESKSRLAAALVPAVADWVSIQVRDEHEQVSDVLVHHREPGLSSVAAVIEQLKRRRGLITEPSRRAADGETVLVPVVDADGLVEHVPDPELRTLVQRLGMGSLLAVPIPGRTGVLGTLLLVNVPGSTRYVESDRVLALEIGRRAGIALENARVYSGQRTVATELQQSLLTAPPSVAFADIAVRYVAAAQQAQVGGDWYDAFRRRDGDLMVVIGDVVGHDTRAAATMGQLRGLLRGICFGTPHGPSESLASVDEAIEGLELGTMATAVLARISVQDGSQDSDRFRLCWSNAGHPPPLLVDPEGQARILEPGTGKADLLLGVDPGTRRSTESMTLPAGSTLLFYTDGLIERRGQTLDEGLEQLVAAVEQHAGDDLEELCDSVLCIMVPRESEDDVALIAVRPRPVADGGPGRQEHPPVRQATVGDRPAAARGAEAATGSLQERSERRLAAVRASWQSSSPVPEGDVVQVIPLTSLRQLSAVRRQVRLRLTHSLRASGASDPAAREDVVERAIQVIDELASNALRHGSLPAELTVLDRNDRWIVVATDSATEVLPQPAVDRPVGHGGYGLYVIADLTVDHGVEIGDDVKRVWAVLSKH